MKLALIAIGLLSTTIYAACVFYLVVVTPVWERKELGN
jgi:hypothetical protein